MKIGRITLSDRAYAGIYKDQSGPEIEKVIMHLFAEPVEFISVLIPDEKNLLVSEFLRLVDELDCPLVLTTGGTGPSSRDVTPEATRLVLEKELPGFGEIMRMESYKKVKTAILSRAVAGIRKRSLIINLPGKPSAIADCLMLLGEAIAECLDHLRGYRPLLAIKDKK
ncbi:molybdopterin adenylyltransferase [Methylacidiphilum sp. Yel]|jgi:molybdopterin adenylyltransferase|uniref:molybdopterin adenylyltransferase n=1 Tax=Methylacidiphilum sp. Yel TaxID=1847730 RepID=UPI00106C8FF1|nr:molybdopterin adenylyltransferase [Methylacidiphilum sp. Yel]TFE70922.1 molybdopterin adenylyltransferase [Methylacidiphilum sp. Yel]